MTTPTKSFCSVCSKAAGIGVAGTGWAAARFVIPEIPLPWPENPLDARSVPPGVPETLTALWNDGVDIGLFAVAPDDAYSVPGKTRILSFDFAANPGGSARSLDYLAPVELVAATIDALARDRHLPAGIEIDDTPYRDAMICTHGSRDACCATFGFPLYRRLRALDMQDANVRVWRASHFGGHRFAPTMMTFPDGRSWGYLDDAISAAILNRTDPVDGPADAYRGWSGYTDEALQILEQEAFRRVGWAWFDYRQTGSVVSEDEAKGVRSAEIVGESVDGERIELRADIVQNGSVSAIGSCGDDDHQSAVYRLTNVEFHARSSDAIGSARTFMAS